MWYTKNLNGEIRTIQPYFILSTSSNYDVRVVKDSPISHFYSFIADRSDGQVIAVPDASVDILFLCDGDQSKARFCGSTTTAKLVEIQQGKRYFGVRFRPGYLPKLMDIESKCLIDAEFSLYDVLSCAEDLITQMGVLSNIDDLSSCFMRYFTGDVAYHYSTLGLQIRELITKHQGDIKIADLELYTGYSSRYISKVFVENFGLSPKSYSLILRFQRILQRIILDHQLSLTLLASEQGYADQSHFFREFKRFAAQAPSLFIQNIKSNISSSNVFMGNEVEAFNKSV